MATSSEADVREMLKRRAGDCAMASVPSEAILRKGGRRKLRTVVVAGATMLAIAVLAGLSMALPRGGYRGLDSAGGDDSTPGVTLSPSPTSGRLRLVDYSVRAPARRSEHAPADTGPTITLNELRRQADCMRSQGFDVPPPTRQPRGGWGIIVHDPKARGLDFRSRSFREAMFVTCGPLGGPLSGDLVIGGPQPKMDRFMSCMRRQGFDLPEPTKDTTGSDQTDEWQFDLTRTTIDTSTPAWNRAMFVTCAPDDI